MRKQHTKTKYEGRVQRTEGKERVTISLSRHSAEYVKKISKRDRSHVSTVMEQMIETVRRAEELKQLSTGIAAFYDRLPDAAVEEDAAWGQLGAAGLAAFVKSEGDESIPEAAPEAGTR